MLGRKHAQVPPQKLQSRFLVGQPDIQASSTALGGPLHNRHRKVLIFILSGAPKLKSLNQDH